jgi:hypothetical protein
MLNSQSKFYEIIRENKKKIIPILIINELDNFGQPKFILPILKFIHTKIIRMGVYFLPLGSFYIPFFSFKKTYMLCGDLIDSTNITSNEELFNLHIEQILKIYEHAKIHWPNIKPLKIIDYGKKKLIFSNS